MSLARTRLIVDVSISTWVRLRSSWKKKGIECVFGRVEGENQGFLLLLFFCDEIARSLLRIAMTDDDSRGR